jgi:hypothetical protein
MMKKVLGLFAMLLFVGATTMTAQENTSPTDVVAEKKSCSATCAAKAATAASLDDNIEKAVCPVTGTVSYTRKDVCEKSGKVTHTKVRYDEATATFVDLDSDVKASTPAAKKGCSKSCSKKCGKGAKAEKPAEEGTSEGA